MTFHVCFENDAKVRLSLSKHQENEFTKSSHFHEEPEKSSQKVHTVHVSPSFPNTCKIVTFSFHPSSKNISSSPLCFKNERKCNTSAHTLPFIFIYHLSFSLCKRKRISFLDFLLSDEVGTSVAVLHQRHRSDEFASPVGVVIIEAADVQDEVGRHVHLLAHPLDICLRVVLVRRCPPLNDGAHGIAVVLHSIRPQQSESSPVAPLHCLELIKTLVVLHFQQTFPLILTSADVQRIAISDSSWYHNFNFSLNSKT